MASNGLSQRLMTVARFTPVKIREEQECSHCPTMTSNGARGNKTARDDVSKIYSRQHLWKLSFILSNPAK